ncbi:hypothetical protein D0Z07_5717 [Hyphodiscus hymeniophilus]|uniref:Uncharacterized protein n=1 Tax=Hyphodiscus hymeniophilus TaxID=353542 RepID=A0A9P6VHI8_9HELO|nr:hypothetical protein D0Z07_5717 [Hyphodiscus hymeniophilus]
MPPPNSNTMPGLTVDTSPRSQQGQSVTSTSNSQSASPVRPPVSPITPTLGLARLAPSPSSSRNVATPNQTYTHAQPPQTAIPQPALVPIAFDDNPDALALKSAISILQIQAKKATADIQSLRAIKEQAMKDPEGFTQALVAGEIKKREDSLFAPSGEDEDMDEDEDEQPIQSSEVKGRKTLPKLPTPQNVVRCPPINWNQYAVVGESLDKMHADQQSRPTEGRPQRLGPDGQLSYGGDGQRRHANLGVAAPYDYGRDKIEKMSTRKGGKR